MKLAVSIIFSLFSQVVFCQNIYIKPDNLSWANFKGKPVLKPDASGELRDYAAFTWSLTHLRLKSTTNGLYEPIVEVVFCQDTSFVKQEYLTKNPRQSHNLLQHELYHYKLSILYGKKLKKHLLSQTLSWAQTAVDIYQEYHKKHVAEQARYDQETDHRHHKANQKMWMKSIDEQLSELANILLDNEAG